MTWHWATNFKRVLATGLWILTLQAGSVHGKVEIVSSQDPDVRKHSDYSGVVVWLDPAAGPAPVPLNRPRIEMLQHNKRFTPHILPIAVGTTVDFPNLDPIYHNAFSNFDGQVFDVGLYPPGSTKSVTFHREGIVRVFCDIHSTMSAVIVVLKSPYFTVSAKSGEFNIANLPPGSYRLHVFHERATQPTLDALTRIVDVPAGAVEEGVIAVSETGYLNLPHKNKYGKDYPVVSPSSGTYSGSKP
jgi:plastocyanin